MPIIEVSKLVKEFGAGRAPLRALDEVSFAVDQGRFVTLVGPRRLRQVHAAANSRRADRGDQRGGAH